MRSVLSLVLFALFALIAVYTVPAQSVVNYHADLSHNGSPLKGSYDFQFTLWDSLTGGHQLGPTKTLSAVVKNGRYDAKLDFGSAAASVKDKFLSASMRRSGTSDAFAPFGPPRFAVNGSDPVAVITATNSAAGIQNPSLSNLPPAAVLAHVTATTDVTAGVIGISDSANGIGVVGIAGTTAANGRSTGVNGLAAATSGQTRAIAASVFSPQGIAYSADAENGALIFDGSNGNSEVFIVDNAGNVIGSAFGNPSGSFETDNAGNIRAHGINVGPPNGQNDSFVVQPDGTTSVAGTFHVGNGLFDVNPTAVSAAGNLGIGGTTTTRFLSVTQKETVGGESNVGSLVVGNGATINGPLGLFVSGSVSANGDLKAANITAHNSASVTGVLTVNGDLHVTGTKNNVVKTADGTSVVLYAMESPEYWFEDFGTVQLRNGRAVITIEPKYAQTVNLSVPYKVFLTPDGNCRGLYVFRKTATSFEVRELGNGHSSISFDYRIVAKRLKYESNRLDNPETLEK